ncbi:MAG: multifunctional 2',3'-cyclic-nucleotide 2'-phosphodiesterase/5'-nucleotidase/3'-nucleotidase [bacterium]|nr:multifunctional 2',3'-cyclic-nucleotide 2'-phosphodiesterase/5'-nucleotidase/3'-nucleotidase [bacterium]
MNHPISIVNKKALFFYERLNRVYRGVLFLTAILALFIFQGCTCQDNRQDVPIELTIAHLNDTHAALEPSVLKMNFNGIGTYVKVGGFAALAGKVKQLRQSTKNFLFLHAGDVFQGSLYFIHYKGQANLEFLKLMELDVMCLGNHEFDKGVDELAKFIDGALESFPIISANVSAEAEPLLRGKIKPYTIKEMSGKKVGIIGLVTEETGNISAPGKNISFSSVLKAAEKNVAELTAQNINIILLLSHLGLKQDIKIAESVPGIDIIIGGHSHSLMGSYARSSHLAPATAYPHTVKNSLNEEVLLLQSWEKGKVMGILKVRFDKAGKVIRYSGHPVILTGNRPRDFQQKNPANNNLREPVDEKTFNAIGAEIKKDPIIEMKPPHKEADELMARLAIPIEELKRKVIGQSGADLPHLPKRGVNTDVSEFMEAQSMASLVVADALLWKAKCLKDKNTQIAIQNVGSVRCEILKGDITIEKVYQLLPFENTLVLLDLSGVELKEALKTAIIRAEGAFPLVAGMRYSADLEKNGGDFFTRIEVDKNGQWVPVENNTNYHIVANNFIAAGKDGYTILEKAKNKVDTGYTDAGTFIEYVKFVKTLKAPERRALVKGKIVRNY